VAAAMDQILQGSAEGSNPRASRATCVIRETATFVAGRDKAHLMTLLAVVAWWQGDCTRTSLYCAKAIAGDPNYRLAQLLQLAAERRIAPGGRRIPDKST